MKLKIQCFFILFTWQMPVYAAAGELSNKSMIALVGDANRFNIRQDGVCGERTEIPQADKIQFGVPSLLKPYFFIRSNLRVLSGIYYCEGDYSFIPEPSRLRIIRHVFKGARCKLEMCRSTPGETPQPKQFKQEAQHSFILP